MNIIDDGSTSNIARGYHPDEDFHVVLSPNIQLVSGSSDAPSAVKDTNLDNVTSAVTHVTQNLQAVVPFRSTVFGPTVFTSDNPSVATVSQSGVVTFVSVGTVNISVSVPGLGVKSYAIAVQNPGGQMVSVFTSFVTGSLGKHVTDGMAALIAGKTPPDLTGMPPFAWNSVMNLFMPDGSRNPSCWLSSIDTTSMARLGQMTALTRDSGVTASHLGTPAAPPGTIFYFSGADGATIAMTVKQSTSLTSGSLYAPDVRAVTFTTDFPSTITPATVLPSTFRNYLPQAQYGYPCVSFGQDHVPRIACMYDTGAVSGLFSKFKAPTNVSQAAFWYDVRGGDSGYPCYMLINGKLVFVTHWTFASGGVSYPDNISLLNAAFASNGSPYSMTPADLTGFKHTGVDW